MDNRCSSSTPVSKIMTERETKCQNIEVHLLRRNKIYKNVLQQKFTGIGIISNIAVVCVGDTLSPSQTRPERTPAMKTIWELCLINHGTLTQPGVRFGGLVGW